MESRILSPPFRRPAMPLSVDLSQYFFYFYLRGRSFSFSSKHRRIQFDQHGDHVSRTVSLAVTSPADGITLALEFFVLWRIVGNAEI